jgi:hypothetical protein
MPCKNGHNAPRDKHGKCAECRRAAGRRNYHKRPAEKRQRRAKWVAANQGAHRKYKGLPDPTRSMPAYCECCGVFILDTKTEFHLDHDHSSGVFRGWLCKKCNLGLGLLGDNADGVRRALAYLERV